MGKTKDEGKSQKMTKRGGFDLTAILMILGCTAGSYALSQFFESKEQAATKPFNSFDEFYPFYISQHADQTCRRLHVVGTSIIALMTAFEPHIVTSFLMAGVVGFGTFTATKHIDHGIIEMVAMIGTFTIFMRKLTGSWSKALMVPVVAYGFAWAGHFFFEMNKPATFIYPVYSLAGDLRLFYDVVSQKIAF
jgi:hypothetical protein